MKAREFWISRHDKSVHEDKLTHLVSFEYHAENNPLHVIEMSAYQALQQENEGLKASIKIIEQDYYKDHAEMFKNELEKLEARHKKLLEELKRHSEGNSSPSDALNVIAEDEKAK